MAGHGSWHGLGPPCSHLVRPHSAFRWGPRKRVCRPCRCARPFALCTGRRAAQLGQAQARLPAAFLVGEASQASAVGSRLVVVPFAT